MNNLKIQFEAGVDGNVLYGENDDLRIYACVEVPEGASEDFGYLTMKNAVLAELSEEEAENVSFWYDGFEESLNVDASADAEVELDITRNQEKAGYAVEGPDGSIAAEYMTFVEAAAHVASAMASDAARGMCSGDAYRIRDLGTGECVTSSDIF